MSRARSASTQKPYGVSRVCSAWEVSRSTLYWRRNYMPPSLPARRPGPEGPCPDEEMVEQIRAVLRESPFHGEGYRKVWARLRHLKDIRTSRRRTLRLMREHGLLAPHRVGRDHGPKAHDGVITTDRPDEMWGTDMTSTVTVHEGQANVFIAVDHCTFECVGVHASRRGNRFEALEPLRQGVREQFGGFGEAVAEGLTLRHDHGSQYMSNHFQDEVSFLGMKSSPAYVREPEGNGCAERFIRMLKENLLWVRTFETVEELRLALMEFKEIYNNEWMLEKHGYKSPRQVRRDKKTLAMAA